jgi:hypothetical protein
MRNAIISHLRKEAISHMKDKKKALYLYEALELRSEYDARIKTLKDCLPESKQNRDRFSFTRDDGIRRSSPDFDAVSARK